jgi:peptidoglycan/xylan/chitin deacetylase (PgdA/CDA1 family)
VLNCGALMKKRYLLIPVIVVLGVLVALWEVSRSRTYQIFGQIFSRVETSQKIVALTFDDGPTDDAVNQLLPVLEEQQVHATFFVIGAELEKNMAAGRRIVAAGHELGNHSYSHERMVLVTPGFVRQEIEKTDQLIREAGYQGEILFRPPFGKKLFALPHYLAKTGRKSITWDVEPDSYPEIAADSNKITDYCISKTRPGSIILLHVMYGSRNESLKSVRGIIEGLKQNGYSFKTVSELLATSSPASSSRPPGSDQPSRATETCCPLARSGSTRRRPLIQRP